MFADLTSQPLLSVKKLTDAQKILFDELAESGIIGRVRFEEDHPKDLYFILN